jgi:hypothetical protein
MFLVPVNILSFARLAFFFHNITLGWGRWYRSWRNRLLRFGGWIILRKWTVAFRRDKFAQKLQKACQHLSRMQRLSSAENEQQ